MKAEVLAREADTVLEPPEPDAKDDAPLVVACLKDIDPEALEYCIGCKDGVPVKSMTVNRRASKKSNEKEVYICKRCM